MLSRRSTLIALSTPGLILALGEVVLAHAAPANALVIVTQKNSALGDLTLRELKRLYQSEQVNGPDGAPIIPLNRPTGSPARVAFDQLVLKMDPDEVGRYWIDRKIRGQTGAPKAIPSLDLLRRAVASVTGTLTYLSASELTADLKVVNVDGKHPTEAGYPLSPA
jgi:ABC-type phosphate transport system substrate-binding protein